MCDIYYYIFGVSIHTQLTKLMIENKIMGTKTNIYVCDGGGLEILKKDYFNTIKCVLNILVSLYRLLTNHCTQQTCLYLI